MQEDNLIEFIKQFRKSGPMVKNNKEFKKIYKEQMEERFKRFLKNKSNWVYNKIKEIKRKWV